jgi:hypothetical protein
MTELKVLCHLASLGWKGLKLAYLICLVLLQTLKTSEKLNIHMPLNASLEYVPANIIN